MLLIHVLSGVVWYVSLHWLHKWFSTATSLNIGFRKTNYVFTAVWCTGHSPLHSEEGSLWGYQQHYGGGGRWGAASQVGVYCLRVLCVLCSIYVVCCMWLFPTYMLDFILYMCVILTYRLSLVVERVIALQPTLLICSELTHHIPTILYVRF